MKAFLRTLLPPKQNSLKKKELNRKSPNIKDATTACFQYPNQKNSFFRERKGGERERNLKETKRIRGYNLKS